VRALHTGEDHVRGGWRSGGGRRQADLEALVPHELGTGAPVDSAAPIPPEQRCGTHSEWMQQHAHLARLGRRGAIPLTLLAQRAGTAPTDAGRIHHAQAAIEFSTPLLDRKRLPCWTPQCPIGLERKVGSCEATCFPRRVAVVGGLYPDAGADEAGRAAVCSLCAGMAGANERRCVWRSVPTDGPVPGAGSTPIGLPVASTPAPRPRASTTGRGPARRLRLKAEAQRRRDAGTVRRHRQR
jgi:hypothetical protein